VRRVPIFTGVETSGWRTGWVEDGSVHIEPVGDLVEHEVDDCVCAPRVEPVKCPDGSIVWMLVHHALDNREQRERQEAA
jgi:hypothetical protein